MNEYDCATVAICVRDFPLMLPDCGLWSYPAEKQMREIDANYLSIVLGMMVKPLEQHDKITITRDSTCTLVKHEDEPPVFDYIFPPKKHD